MKKTLVALAVSAVAATSANAAVVYNQDGTKVEVGGSVRLILQKAKDKRTDLLNNGSRVVVKASHDLGEGFSALGNLELRLSGDDLGDQVKTKRLYAGFSQKDIGTLTFGKQLTTGDDLGLSDYTYNLGGINKVTDASDKVIHFKSAEWEGFSFGADYIFRDSAKTKSSNGYEYATNNNSGFVLGAFYNRQFGDFGFAIEGGYGQDQYSVVKTADTNGNFTETTPKYKQRAFTVGTELSYGPVAFAVDYSQRKATKNQAVSWRTSNADGTGTVINEFNNMQFNKIRELEIGVKYQFIEESKVYFDYINGRANVKNTEDTNGVSVSKLNAFIGGIDYKFNKNVLTYLEGGHFRYKTGDVKYNDHKVNLGLRVFF